MYDGTLRFDTEIDRSGFESGLSKLGSLAKTGMAAVGTAVTAVSAGISALGGYAVSVGKDFESSMAQVVATMGITKDTVQGGVNSYELLKEAAAAAGESTTFSASQAADALNYLALAGYDAVKAADALPAVLDLAAAGGLELGYASDLATDAMAALGIEATKVNLTHFGDQLAKTASRANTSVSQLGEAILTVGGTAKELAGGTDELNATLGVLANRGIKGSEGGTHLRNMILSLVAPTDKAFVALRELGVSAVDAENHLRPLNEVFADLKAAGADTETLNRIFNRTDLAAVQAMMAGCGEEFADLTAEIKNCDGAMADMAYTMNDTLEGDLKSLQSKSEAFGIAIYDALNEPLRELVQLGGEYVSQLTAAFKSDGFEGLAVAFGDVLGQAVTKITEYIPTIAKMGTSVVTEFVDGIIGNIGAITDAVSQVTVIIFAAFLDIMTTLAGGITEAAPQLFDAAAEGIVQLVSGFTSALPELANAAVSAVSVMAESFVSSIPTLLNAGITLIESLADTFAENLPLLLSSVSTIGTQHAGMIADCLPELISAAQQLIDGLVGQLPELIGTVTDTAAQLLGTVTDILPVLTEAGLTLMQGFISGILDSLPLLLDAAVSLAGELVGTLTDCIPLVTDTALQLLTELADFLIQSAPMLLSAAIKLFSGLVDALPQVISALSSQLPQIIDAVIGLIPQIAEALTEAMPLIVKTVADALPVIIDALAAALPDLMTGFITLLASFDGAILDAAVELFSALVDAIPVILRSLLDQLPTIITAVVTTLIEAAPVLAESSFTFFSELIKALPEVISQLMEYLGELAGTILAWLGDIFAKAWEAISTWFSETVEDTKQGAIDIVTGIMEFLGELPGKVGEMLGTALANIIVWCSEAPEKAREAASRFLENVKSFFSQLPGNIKDFLSSAILKVAEWAVSLREKGRNAAKDLVDSVVSGIASLPSKMADAGKNLIQGLWNGITSAGNWLREKISDFGTGIINGFKSAFGIASPSKVMRDEVGRYLAEGVGVGFTSGLPDIASEAEKKLTELTLPELELSVSEPMLPKLQPAPVLTADSGLINAVRTAERLILPEIPPSVTSQITNSYYYGGDTNEYSTAAQSAPSKPEKIVLNARFVIGEEVVAEGVQTLIADAVDRRQGIEVQLKKRGLTV